MNFTLTNRNVNEEICNWFETHKDELPQTLDTQDMYIGSPAYQAEVWIYQIQQTKPGSETYRFALYGLKQMYKALKNPDNWNKPMKKL